MKLFELLFSGNVRGDRGLRSHYTTLAYKGIWRLLKV